MNVRCVHVLVIFASWLSIGQEGALAADPPSIFEPEFGVCTTPVSSKEEERLKAEQHKYESLIAPLQLKLETLNKLDSEESKSLEAELRPIQVNLLRILERLECKRLSALNDVVVRGPPPRSSTSLRCASSTHRPP